MPPGGPRTPPREAEVSNGQPLLITTRNIMPPSRPRSLAIKALVSDKRLLFSTTRTKAPAFPPVRTDISHDEHRSTILANDQLQREPRTAAHMAKVSNQRSLFSTVRIAAPACHKFDILASNQLQRELDQSLVQHSPAQAEPNNTASSPLYTKLPTELRQQVFSYLVTVPETVHIHPVNNNPRLGFRLFRCADDNATDLRKGMCRCEGIGRLSLSAAPPSPPAFLDTNLLLLSHTIRREALDLIFSRNRFAFTSLRDLYYFATKFTLEARAIVGELRTLELFVYLDDLSKYEEPYVDGFIVPFLPLRFGHPQLRRAASSQDMTKAHSNDKLPLDVHIKVALGSLRLTTGSLRQEMTTYVKERLENVFDGKWASQEDVPMAKKPKEEVPTYEREPEDRRGLLFMGD
ncbi:uncharacterized protein AB675_10875 [Cyphellophora attinorum]|uniref:DUF7730 domain-containing protein n=1 Tax=Cyphellophora attinorum TaxID=1664694 RepID=A0A0N1HAJ3_9EURO|nr:uncharacterized protein AB675_10875 [Phialophora attinorum]KPI40882.1 hypothetical protein AB675_10875 [Phialophora attinorum]